MSWKSMQRAIDAVRDEGREQGIEQGVARGLEMGRREAKFEALREVVVWRFGMEVWVVAEARGWDPTWRWVSRET